MLALTSLLATSAIPEHEIKSLPGWSGPLPSRQYSGYLPVGKTSGVPGFIHYWLILSERDPASDPLVYWTNGGPGGSGINAGLLTEMGQWHLNEDSLTNNTQDMPKLLYNEYNWAKVASTLYVSQPKGVGFSYCDESVPKSQCVNTDLSSAQDAVDFFHAFFAAYPEFKPLDFYLTAESYGGIYLPTFMKLMDADGGFPNLKGAAIGDGCWGNQVGLCAFTSGKAAQIQIETYHGHSMISNELYTKLNAACGPWGNDGVQNAKCQTLLQEADEAAGSFDVYNIYDTCAGDTIGAWNKKGSEWNALRDQQSIVVEGDVPRPSGLALGTALNDYPCGGDRVTREWLGKPEVAAALHVKTNTGGMRYNKGPMDFSGNLLPLYDTLLRKYRMLIYSGDTDACVPTWGTVDWIDSLNLPVKKEWRQWTAPLTSSPDAKRQRAGYVKDYAVNNFTFATVQGAGHMVPTYKPNFALQMLSRWLEGKPLDS